MKHLLILVVLVGGLLGLVAGKIDTGPYGYDEADYMFAASLGYFTNWMDAGSLPVGDFLKIGLNRGAREQRLALSQMARQGSDPVVYRHWHGPLYYYWLTFLSPWNLAEETMRRLSLVFPILTAIVLYFGTLRVLPAPAAQPAAILSCALLLWGQMTVKTTELTPHMLFILCYVSALLLLAKIMSGGGRRLWYLAVFLAGLACCTLEVAFALLATLLLCACLRRHELHVDWAFARNSILAWLAAVLLFWPAAILRLSFIKGYLSMAYLALFRKGAWGNGGFLQGWALRFEISPLEWLLVAAALLIFFSGRLWRSLPALLPFLLYSLLMALALVRVAGEGPRYMAPFFPALIIFASWTVAWVLARMKTPHRSPVGYACVAAVCALLFWTTRWQVAGYLLQSNPYPRAMLAAVRERGLAAKTVLAPQVDVPALHYYFPQTTFRGYLDTAEIPGAIEANHADAVLYPGYPVRLVAGKTPATP